MLWMKMLDSMVCVAACASRGRAEQLEKASQAALPSLIITSGQVGLYRTWHVRTRAFAQATLAEYGMDKGRVANGELVGTWKRVSGEILTGGCGFPPILTTSPYRSCRRLRYLCCSPVPLRYAAHHLDVSKPDQHAENASGRAA